MTQKSEERHAEALLEEYGRLAPEYDTRWAFYIRTTVNETVARLALRSGDRLLEVGCGTGALLHALREKFPEVKLTGIDPVPEMLAIARRNLGEDMALHEAWAESLPFPDSSFEAVVSCNMFHYVSQPEATLAEMKRVLVPGGEMIITDWCDDYLSCRLCDWYLRHFNDAHYKVYRLRELQEMLQAAGMQDTRMERYKINWLWGLMTARARKPAF